MKPPRTPTPIPPDAVLLLHKDERVVGVLVGERLHTHNFVMPTPDGRLPWTYADWRRIEHDELPERLRYGLVAAALRSAGA